MTRQRLRQLLADIAGLRTLVVGDAMLDEYIWGTAERVSPEAPVLVVRSQRVTHVPGGAANAIHNARACGAAAGLVAVRGCDTAGDQLAQALAETGAAPLHLLPDGCRPTTVKTRVVAHSQQVVRIDKESTAPLSAELAAAVVATVEQSLDGCAGLLLSDYDKGVLVPATILGIMAAAAQRNVPVAVNAKPRHTACYRGATLLTVNRVEAAELCGFHPATPREAAAAARQLLDTYGVELVLVTLGGDGAVLAGDGAHPRHVPAVEVEVYDPAGAGDTTVAAAHLALSAGATPLEAVELAMRAAAVVVRKVGVQPVTPAEILALHG